MKQYAYFFIGLFLISYVPVQAQYKPYYYKDHEVGATVKVGMHQNYGSLPNSITADLKVATAIGLQYDYYLTPNWSIGLGVQYANQTTDFTARNLKGTSQETDWENETFTFSYDGKKYKEQWKVSQFNIPVTVQYVGKGETALYIRTGVQYSLMMSTKTTLTWNQLQTSGYFPQYNLHLDQDLLYAGFGYQDQVEYKPDAELKNRWAWIGEFGVRHNLRDNQNLYIGVYVDLGLNNQKSSGGEKPKQLVVYQPIPDQALTYHSLQESTTTVFKNYNFGIQLRYSIGL